MHILQQLIRQIEQKIRFQKMLQINLRANEHAYNLGSEVKNVYYFC